MSTAAGMEPGPPPKAGPPGASPTQVLIGNVQRGARKFFTSRKGKQSVALVIGMIVGLSGLFAYQHGKYAVTDVAGAAPTGANPFANYVDMNGSTISTDGQATEGQATAVPTPIEQENLDSVTVTLTWTDEPSGSSLKTNTPDSFTLDVTTPDGTAGSGSDTNAQDQPGTIVVTLTRDLTARETDPKAWNGTWAINVTCSDAGDTVPRYGPSIFGIRTTPDTGNAFTLTIDYMFKAKK